MAEITKSNNAYPMYCTLLVWADIIIATYIGDLLCLALQ